MTKNKESTRYYSTIQENRVAALVEGQRSANSGASLFSKGDVVCQRASLLIECKTQMADKDSFSIKKDWITKNKKEMFEQRLSYGALAFNFGPNQENYFVINEDLFVFLCDKLEEELN